MWKKIIPFLLLPLLAAHAANLTLDETSINFGEKYQFDVATHDLRVWNRSNAPIELVEPKASKSGITLSFGKKTLAPGESTTVHIKWPLQSIVGTIAVRMHIDTVESGKNESYSFMFRGFVNTILSEPHPTLDFGVVDTLHEPPSQSISLESDLDATMRITDIADLPDDLSARVGENGKSIVVQPKSFAVLGPHDEVLTVHLDSALQKQAAVRVVMDTHGKIVPDQNPVDFGLQRPKTSRTARLQLTSRDNSAVHIGKVTPAPNSNVSVESVPCLPKARQDCKAFLLTLNKDHPLGSVYGTIDFELPDTKQRLNVGISGMFVADDTVIRTTEDSTPSKQPAPADLSQSLKKAVQPPQPAVEPPPGKGPLLKWSVANEASIYGYAVFRSDTKDGRYVRINDAIIAAKNGGNESSASYQWRDTSAQPGKDYWYYISIYYGTGKRVQLTSPQKVTVAGS